MDDAPQGEGGLLSGVKRLIALLGLSLSSDIPKETPDVIKKPYASTSRILDAS